MKSRHTSLFTLGSMFAATKSFIVHSSSIHLQRGSAFQPTSRLKLIFNTARSSHSPNDHDNRATSESSKEDVNVTFETASNAKQLIIQKGEILRSAMLKRGVSPHNGRSRLINCRGLGTCGTCAVEVTSNRSSSSSSSSNNDHDDDEAIAPRERNAKERLRLNFPPHGSDDQSSNLRLACQIQINDSVTIKKRTGFWGQNTDELAEEFESELWFGELEFILDDKSPSRKAE